MNKWLIAACLGIILSACSSKSTKQTEVKPVDIQFIRNATLKIKYAGKTLLIDPMLGEKNSFMSFVVEGENLNPTVDLPIPAEQVIEGIDAVLLTHPHMDHFDQKAKDILPKSVPFYVQPTDEQRVAESGFQNVITIADSATFEGIRIYRTTGKHASEEGMAKALGPVSGFVLQATDHPTIYIIGDCVWDADIERQLAEYKPDIIVTNSGGALLGGQRILMDEAETITVAKTDNTANVIATHMEALDHCKVTRNSMQTAAKAAAVSILTPKDGELVKF